MVTNNFLKVMSKSSTGHCWAHGDVSELLHDDMNTEGPWVTEHSCCPSPLFTVRNSWTGGEELILDGHPRMRTYRHIHALSVSSSSRRKIMTWMDVFCWHDPTCKEKVRSEINQTDYWIIVHVKCWCANDTEENDASPPHLYKYDD